MSTVLPHSTLVSTLRSAGLNVDNPGGSVIELYDTSDTAHDTFYEIIGDLGFVVTSSGKRPDGLSVTVSSDPADVRTAYMFTPDAVDREWSVYQDAITQRVYGLLPQYAELQAAVIRQPEWAAFSDGMVSVAEFWGWVFILAHDSRLTQSQLMDEFMEMDGLLRVTSGRLLSRHPGLLSVARHTPSALTWAGWLGFFIRKMDELKERAATHGGD